MTHDADLARLLVLASAMHYGQGALADRLNELAAGYPRGGDGTGRRSSDALTATEAAAVNALAGTDDPAADLNGTWRNHIRRALAEAERAWEVYSRTVMLKPGSLTRLGADKLADPGCELCNRIPCGDRKCERCPSLGVPHWCPVYASVEAPVAASKGKPATVRLVPLCVSCYEFQRPLPRGAGRLPTHDEVLDHAQGIRRKRTVSA